MHDLVLAENLPSARGIRENVAAQALKAFRQPKSQEEAKAAARTKGAVLYSQSYDFDDGVYQDLAKASGSVAFSFSDVLGEQGFRRAIVISKMRLAMQCCRKSGCGFVFCTLAKDGAELRNARELEAFMAVVGLGQHEKEFAEKNSERLAAV